MNPVLAAGDADMACKFYEPLHCVGVGGESRLTSV